MHACGFSFPLLGFEFDLEDHFVALLEVEEKVLVQFAFWEKSEF